MFIFVDGHVSKIKSPIKFTFMLAGLIITGVFFILTTVFSLISWPPYADFLLDRNAILTTGQIMEDPKVVSHRRYSHTPNRISMEVKLNISDSNNVVNITAFPSSNYEKGAKIEVEYLANNPSLARIKGDQYGIFGYKIILIMLSGMLVGLVILFSSRYFPPSL